MDQYRITEISLRHSRITTISEIKDNFDLSPADAKDMMELLLAKTIERTFHFEELNRIKGIFWNVHYEKVVTEEEAARLAEEQAAGRQREKDLDEAHKWYASLPITDKKKVDLLMHEMIPTAG